jgi:hypothetical protein
VTKLVIPDLSVSSCNPMSIRMIIFILGIIMRGCAI